MSAVRRIDKVDALVAAELSALFVRDAEFPVGAVISILRIETSRDLKHAKVTLSVMPEEHTKTVLATLEELRRAFEATLHKRLVMKFTPRLHFRTDHSLAVQQHMERVLDQVKKNGE